MRSTTAAAVALAAALTLAGCSGGGKDKKESQARDGHSTARTTATTGLPTAAELAQARKDVSKLSTKDLAGQVIVGFYTGRDADSAAQAIRQDHLGGVVVMGDNVPGDVRSTMPKITSAAQQAMKDTGRDWPAIIGTDQEGGPVARFGPPVTALPAGMAYGAADDEKLATTVAKGQGEELRALGLNMVFAPDADVTIGPQDPAIGVRSPGSDPQRVSRAVTGQVAGFQQAGLVPVIKHFPGHGSVTTDTHVDYATQAMSLAALMKRDWVPFSAATKAGAPAIMTAHIVLKDADPNVPSTLTPKVLTDQLRTKLGFKGLIVTDGMNMGAIVKTFDKGGAAAVNALKAGADVVLMPAHPGESVSAIVKAVESGVLSRERLIDSAARIVATLRHQNVKPPSVDVVGSHGGDATALAKKSITQLGGTCGRRMIGDTVALEGGSATDRQMLTAALSKRGVAVSPSGTKVSLIADRMYNAGKASAEGGSEATSTGKDAFEVDPSAKVYVALGAPYALSKRPSGTVGLAAFGQTPATFDVLADVLVGKVRPGGTLPVKVGPDEVGSSACG